MKNIFNVMREDGIGKSAAHIKLIESFNTPGEAMRYVDAIGDPLALSNTWELEMEMFDGDGIIANKTKHGFQYENVHNGDIREIVYYVEWIKEE